jgi:uncharacterized membrane protein
MTGGLVPNLLAVGAGILAGGLVMVAAAVMPTLRSLPLSTYVAAHQELDRRIERFMPWVGRTTAAAATGYLVLGDSERLPVGLGLALVAVVVLVSETVNVPINRAIGAWRPDRPPADASFVIARWMRFNAIRTVAAFGALVCFAAAA